MSACMPIPADIVGEHDPECRREALCFWDWHMCGLCERATRAAEAETWRHVEAERARASASAARSRRIAAARDAAIAAARAWAADMPSTTLADAVRALDDAERQS